MLFRSCVFGRDLRVKKNTFPDNRNPRYETVYRGFLLESVLFWYIIVISKTENTGVVEMRVFKRKSGGTIDEAESQNKKAGDQI